MTTPARAAYDDLPIQVWTARPDGTLDYVNPAVTQYFGTAAERILEDGWKDLCHPLDLVDAGQRWAQALATGESYEAVFRLLGGVDGQYRWHVARASAVRGADGAISHWVGTNSEVDALKRAEEIADATLLRNQHERGRWHALFAQVPLAIIVTTGAEHRIELCNPAARELGVAAEVGGLPLAQAFPALVAHLGKGALDRTLAGGEPVATRGFALTTPSGAARRLDTICSPLRDDHGAIRGLVVVAIDSASPARS